MEELISRAIKAAYAVDGKEVKQCSVRVKTAHIGNSAAMTDATST